MHVCELACHRRLILSVKDLLQQICLVDLVDKFKAVSNSVDMPSLLADWLIGPANFKNKVKVATSKLIRTNILVMHCV